MFLNYEEQHFRCISVQSLNIYSINLLELINALAEHKGTTLEEINNIRKRKAEERGGFSDRVFLIEVTDN
ncbi:hypothetical protein AT269_02245 [Bacillus cereus]|nr:hypothetical protein AT269_02245 [Bacillus cereus]